MANYNYYNNLTNRFKKNSSIGQKEKTYMPTFDKPVYEGYNGEKTKSYTSSYEYKPGYGNTQNMWWETNSRRGDNSLYKPKVSEKEKPIYRKTDFQKNNLVKDRFNISNPSFKGDPWFEITLPDTTYDPGFLISDNTENPWKDTFKKKAQNQWYNKIAHGSFKEDDWFDSMVKNQEKAENWYKNTYGEKEGKKEFNNLHNRLVTTPFDKIKEEEKQFTNYKASDFKVPEIKPVKYSYSATTRNKSEAKLEPFDEYVKSLNIIQKETGGNIQKSYIIKNIDDIYEKSDYFSQKNLSELRQKALEFDDETFNRLIFLNASDGAKGLGHAGVLLLNEKNEGIVFSFYSVNNSFPEVLNNDAEMRVGILNEKQVNSFLYGDGKLYNLITSTDSLKEEQYDRFVYRDITAEQGKKMFEKGTQIFSIPGRYKLFGRQCDNIASEIVNAGGVEYFVNIMPNLSYDLIWSPNKWSIE